MQPQLGNENGDIHRQRANDVKFGPRTPEERQAENRDDSEDDRESSPPRRRPDETEKTQKRGEKTQRGQDREDATYDPQSKLERVGQQSGFEVSD